MSIRSNFKTKLLTATILSALLGVPSVATAFAPTDIANLEVWLDADDASTVTEVSGTVTNWADKSGNSHDAAQGSVSLQPIYQTGIQNGLSGVLFADTGDVMSISNTTALAAIDDETTVFMVMKAAPTSAFRILGYRKWSGSGDGVYWQNDSSNNWYTKIVTSGGSATTTPRPALWDGVTHISGMRLNSGAYDLYLDGTTTATNTYTHDTGFGNTSQIDLCTEINGHCFEVLVFSRSLTDVEVLTVNTYLNDKWAIY